MGRKKKKVIEELKQEEIKTSSNSIISYQGKVQVSVQHGNKIISKKTFHNKGYLKLFKFICNCLGGIYENNQRPQKIALFKAGGGETPEAEDADKYSYNNLITPVILNDTTAIVKEGNDGQNYTVTYHFKIPYAYINGSSIYKAALFNLSTTGWSAQASPINDLYATFEFLNTTGDIYEPLVIDTSVTGNFNLIIEWTMMLKNVEETKN